MDGLAVAVQQPLERPRRGGAAARRRTPPRRAERPRRPARRRGAVHHGPVRTGRGGGAHAVGAQSARDGPPGCGPARRVSRAAAVHGDEDGVVTSRAATIIFSRVKSTRKELLATISADRAPCACAAVSDARSARRCSSTWTVRPTISPRPPAPRTRRRDDAAARHRRKPVRPRGAPARDVRPRAARPAGRAGRRRPRPPHGLVLVVGFAAHRRRSMTAPWTAFTGALPGACRTRGPSTAR